jgi:hypothetical protein
MDPVTIVQALLEWVIKGIEGRDRSRNAEIDRFITDLQTTCRDLARLEDPYGEEAVLLHERLKQMYDLLLERLPDKFIEGHGGDPYRAISSARIYYWLRIVTVISHEELQRLFSDRNRKSSSFERLAGMLQKASEGVDESGVLDPEAVDEIRRECLRDVERLSLIRPRSAGVAVVPDQTS